MKSIGDFFYLIFLFWVVKWKNFLEEKRVRKQFYRHFYFKLCDRALKKEYRFCSAYSISKYFLKKRGEEEVHAYGETPLTVMKKIADECGLGPRDVFVELGSGRGRGVFFISTLYGCKGVGYEWVPEFCQKAIKVSSLLPYPLVSFECRDMKEANLRSASLVYLYGTCLKEKCIMDIIKALKSLPQGAKVVSVSYPLTDYEKEAFSILNTFEAPFPWGRAEVFIQKRN